MKRLLSPILRGRSILQYLSYNTPQRSSFFSHGNFSQFKALCENEKSDDDNNDNEASEYSYLLDEEEERTTWQKVKRAMVWKRHLQPDDEDDLEEIDPEDLPDPDAFDFRRSDYVFWVYMVTAGIIALVFLKLQSSSRPFYMKYLPMVRRTIENLDNRILFDIIREKAWGRIISIIENGAKEAEERKNNVKAEVEQGGEGKDGEKEFYYHKNLAVILKNIFGEDVKKDDLHLLNTNFICKPTHVFYMLPIVMKRKGWLKKMIRMSYYETRFEVFLPLIHKKTKICCVVKIQMKTTTDPMSLKKNTFRPKIKAPLVHREVEEEEEDGRAGSYIPEHQRAKDTLSDIDFEDEKKLEELEQTLSEEEKKLSEKELKKYISLVEEEERRVIEERKQMEKDEGIVRPKKKKKRSGLFGGPVKSNEDEDITRGPPEFKSLDMEIENISLVHVKAIMDNFDPSFFNQLPLHLINEALRFNWPYENPESYQRQVKDEESKDEVKKIEKDPDFVEEIVVVKKNQVQEKAKVLSDRIPIFVAPSDPVIGFIVPTEHEKKYLPVEEIDRF